MFARIIWVDMAGVAV